MRRPRAIGKGRKVLAMPHVQRIEGTSAQAVLEHAVKSFHSFVAEHGRPRAMALVIQSDDGMSEPFWFVADETRLREFLALAGTMLQKEAVAEVDED